MIEYFDTEQEANEYQKECYARYCKHISNQRDGFLEDISTKKKVEVSKVLNSEIVSEKYPVYGRLYNGEIVKDRGVTTAWSEVTYDEELKKWAVVAYYEV